MHKYRLWQFKRFSPAGVKIRDSEPSNISSGHNDDVDLQSDEPDYEDFLPSPPLPLSAMARHPAPSSVKPALILMSLSLSTSIPRWSMSRDGIGDTSVSYKAVFENHQWWRLLTALFTHSDLGHLLSNAPLFIIFGWFLRDFFGFFVFPTTVVVIGILANVMTIALYSPETQLLGASGMLYGMVALWLVLYVHFETKYSRGQRIIRVLGVSLILLAPTTFHESTSYLCHSFGFLLGIIAGFLLKPFLKLNTMSNTH